MPEHFPGLDLFFDPPVESADRAFLNTGAALFAGERETAVECRSDNRFKSAVHRSEEMLVDDLTADFYAGSATDAFLPVVDDDRMAGIRSAVRTFAAVLFRIAAEKR